MSAKITRERFIDHFAVSVQVHSLKLWHRRSKSPPVHVARSVYDVIAMSAGSVPITSPAFGEIVAPMIADLHRRTPQGARPDAKELTGLVYDALDRAGVEVTIKPPVPAHGR